MRTVPIWLTAIALALPSICWSQEPVSLERTLVRAAPDILKHCRDHGYKNVGVLKFLVHKADTDTLSDNVGTLNRTVARRLELGMILANNAREPIGVIENASDVAASIPGANHLTREGRLKLFERKYPLAWGKDPVTADAFITGLVSVSADLKALNIKLLVFDKSTNKLGPIGKDLVAANDPRKLSELGESFTRGAFDDGSVETKPNAQEDPKLRAKKDEQTLIRAAEVKTQAAKNPAADPAAPIKLVVLYDDTPVPIEVRDGRAFAPEPLEGQRVTLRLTRTPTARGTLACVVKVNGDNTLFRERLPDTSCRKWLLEPGDGPLDLIGFQADGNTTELFRVLSKAASKAREIDYGADVGTITLTVFAEQVGRLARGDLTDETQNTKVLERGKVPAQKPDSFASLTAKLLEDSERGLIESGAKVGSAINVVKFTADPTPLMSLTVTYYKK